MAEIGTAIGKLEKSSGVSALTGTVSSSGTTLTGTSTMFTSELDVGDVIVKNGETEKKIVTAIASNTSATVDSAFTTALSGASVDVLTFTEITQATSLSGLAGSRNVIPVSSWSRGISVVKVLGRKDEGDATFTMWLDPKIAVHAALKTDQEADTDRAWRVWLNDSSAGTAIPDVSNSRIVFRGRISGLPLDIPDDGAVSANPTIAVSGAVIWAAGT